MPRSPIYTLTHLEPSPSAPKRSQVGVHVFERRFVRRRSTGHPGVRQELGRRGTPRGVFLKQLTDGEEDDSVREIRANFFHEQN